jgi:hypothetical protein
MSVLPNAGEARTKAALAAAKRRGQNFGVLSPPLRQTRAIAKERMCHKGFAMTCGGSKGRLRATGWSSSGRRQRADGDPTCGVSPYNGERSFFTPSAGTPNAAN